MCKCDLTEIYNVKVSKNMQKNRNIRKFQEILRDKPSCSEISPSK